MYKGKKNEQLFKPGRAIISEVVVTPWRDEISGLGFGEEFQLAFQVFRLCFFFFLHIQHFLIGFYGGPYFQLELSPLPLEFGYVFMNLG
jgi:hypothetical protein